MLPPEPDVTAHSPKDYIYFKRLLNLARLTYADAAFLLGFSERTIAKYATKGGYDYPTQFTLECLVAGLHRKKVQEVHGQAPG